MSQRNVELARRIVTAWNTGGVNALLEFCPADVVWHPFAEWPDGGEPRTGHAGVRELMGAWTDNFDGYEVEVHDVHDLEDRVLVHGEMTGKAKGSGVPIAQPLGWICSDFRDGQIGEVRFFVTWEETLEAAGLRA
jgi:ketosteroid isomerase-like protein